MQQRFARTLVLVVMLTWAPSIAADAAVTFDFQDGSGFVDRSEVQAALGLNYGQLQKRAAQVVFSTLERHTFAVNCISGAVREAFSETIANVDFTIVPTKGSLDGFALAGFRDVLISDPLPPERICGESGSFGGQIGVVRRLSASLGGHSAVLLEEH